MKINTYDGIMSDGYGIMPNKVLFDKNLSDKQKLLYCLISSLCAEKGYCWATNDYLSEKVDCTKNNITKMVKKLCDEGYLTIEINKKYGNQRKLRVNSIIQKDCPIIPKDYTPIIPKDYHNNIIDNNTINNKENTKTSIKHPTQSLGNSWSGGLTLSENVIERLIEYNNIRKKKLEKLTDKGRELVINKLKTLGHGTDEGMIAVLQQSIENGWEGLFEVKGFKPTIDYENDLGAFYNEMKRDYEGLKNKLGVEKFMQLKQKALRYAAENKLL